MVEIRARPYEFVDPSHHNFVDSQRAMVLSCIKEFRLGVCDRMISSLTDVPVNLVTARRNELVKMGLVSFVFKAKSPFSKVRVKHWGVTK